MSIPDVKCVEAACAEALEPLAVKMKNGIGLLPLNENFFGWFGLNSGKHSNFLRINLFVGVHCIPVMEMVALANGEKYKKGRYATYADHFRIVNPVEDELLIKDEKDLISIVARISSFVKNHGVPYIRSLSSYPELIPLLKMRLPSFGGYPQRYASALFLNGEKDAAIDFINEEVCDLKGAGADEIVISLLKLRDMMK